MSVWVLYWNVCCESFYWHMGLDVRWMYIMLQIQRKKILQWNPWASLTIITCSLVQPTQVLICFNHRNKRFQLHPTVPLYCDHYCTCHTILIEKNIGSCPLALIKSISQNPLDINYPLLWFGLHKPSGRLSRVLQRHFNLLLRHQRFWIWQYRW